MAVMMWIKLVPMLKDYPPFEQAVDRLRDFLKTGGLPEAIAWVAPGDAAFVGPYLYIHLPDADFALDRARSEYRRGCQRDLGVQLSALCKIGPISCCYVYVPEDDDESARHMMPDGLKLSYPIPVRNAHLIGNPLRWRILKWQTRRRETRTLSLFDREG